MIYRIFLFLCLCVFSSACSSSKQKGGEPVDEFRGGTSIRELPPVLIYRTKQDYSRNVPVIMNDEKTKIVAYPSPSDLCPGGKCSYPTPLAEGFWLDHRGIGKNVVFLSYTYEEYAARLSPPSPEEMVEHIIDKDPLVALYNCGSRNAFKDTVKELNELIQNETYKNKHNLLK